MRDSKRAQKLTHASREKKRYRVFVLGAGFSVPAGLPQASELYSEIQERVTAEFGPDNRLKHDLDDYIEYRSRCDGVNLNPDDVDFERFLAFLDHEHYLDLRGSDTWTDHGNQGQILVKKAIGKIIHERTPSVSDVPSLYTSFADRLQPGDYVLTFNYDALLERAMERVNKPYRLFPTRFAEIGEYVNTVDSSRDEVVVLKIHGSVDWFSREDHHFPDGYSPSPIVDGPRDEMDPLKELHRIGDVDQFYENGWPSAAPAVLSPSHSKIVYMSRLHQFLSGAGQAGGWNLGFTIIGFSLSDQDEYIRQVLYRLVRNYQDSWWDEELLDGMKKSKLKLVDFPHTDEATDELLARYRFVNWDRAVAYMAGFDNDTLDLIFSDDH